MESVVLMTSKADRAFPGETVDARKSQWQNFRVIVPTLNAAADWPRFAPALLNCVRPEQVLIVDSESTDGTPDLARQAGFEVASINRKTFNHGGTRQLAAEMVPDAEIVAYMTQDAVLADVNSMARLLPHSTTSPWLRRMGGSCPDPKPARSRRTRERLTIRRRLICGTSQAENALASKQFSCRTLLPHTADRRS